MNKLKNFFSEYLIPIIATIGLFLVAIYLGNVDLFEFFIVLILTEMLVGWLYGYVILPWRKERRWGGWRIKLENAAWPNSFQPERAISATKAEQILTDDSDLSVYAKGLISTYGRTEVDIVQEKDEKEENGNLVIKYKARTLKSQEEYTTMYVNYASQRITVLLDEKTFKPYPQYNYNTENQSDESDNIAL